MDPTDLDTRSKDKQGRAPEWDGARRMLAGAVPPERVEDALLRAFARRHPPVPWYRRWTVARAGRWAGLAATGCVLALAAVALRPAHAPAPHARSAAAAAPDGFLSLVPAERIAAAAHPRLKQADLTRQALVQLGIPIAADAPDELVHAELLVAANGEPLALRLAVN